MEKNLEKAKRLIKDNAAIQGVDLSEECFIMTMLELAATPDNPINDVNVELWQLKKIQNALRLTSNIHDCKCKVTSWDRQVIEALEFTDDAISNAEKQME